MLFDADLAPLTESELAAIQNRADRATPGPWCHREGFIESLGEHSHLLAVTLQRSEEGEGTLPGFDNAEFIAHARRDVPRLLCEIERLRTELAQFARPDSSLVDVVASVIHGR